MTTWADEYVTMLEDCEKYLKEGETPAQRIERERRDTEAVLNLLIREKRKTERMREALQQIAQHFSSDWPERCQSHVLAARHALTERPNDRVEGRDAALSRRVPSHDGLCGNGNYNERTDK